VYARNFDRLKLSRIFRVKERIIEIDLHSSSTLKCFSSSCMRPTIPNLFQIFPSLRRSFTLWSAKQHRPFENWTGKFYFSGFDSQTVVALAVHGFYIGSFIKNSSVW